MPTESVSYRLRTRDLTYVALCAVLIAVCAWISIPAPVPFTLQTFGIFAALTLLGGRRGCYAVAVYLLLGLVGLPVFAGFQGGAGTLLGVTGGYILGFGAAALIYWLVTARLGASLPVSILACVLGLLVCYAFGTAWFVAVYLQGGKAVSVLSALLLCVVPYLLPDLLKLTLAAVIAKRVG